MAASSCLDDGLHQLVEALDFVANDGDRSGCKTTQRALQATGLREIFDAVDSSGDGCIDVTEIAELLQTLGQQCTQAGLRDIVRRLDEDGSGTIDFDEFAALITQFQQQELRDVFACARPQPWSSPM